MAELNSINLFSDANLKGYWRLESDGTDSSASGYTVTGTISSYVPVKFGNGGFFVASNKHYLSRASVSDLKTTGSQTWSCWVKPNSIGVNQNAMAICDSGVTTNFCRLAIHSSGKVSFLIRDATITGYSNGEMLSDGIMSSGNLYHIAGVYDGSTIKTYLNGVKTQATVTSPHSTNNTGSFSIGRLGDFDGEYMDGYIDDVSFFSRALTDSEILELFNDKFQNSRFYFM